MLYFCPSPLAKINGPGKTTRVDPHASFWPMIKFSMITATSGIIACKLVSLVLHTRCYEPQSRRVYKANWSIRSPLILEAIDLLNTARKLPSDEQQAVDDMGWFLDLENAVNPVADLNKTITVESWNPVVGKHTNAEEATKVQKRKKGAPKSETKGWTWERRINTTKTIPEPDMRILEDLAREKDEVNNWLTVTWWSGLPIMIT